MTRSFDVFFDLRLNKRLSKQWRCELSEMPSCSLWRHCNGSYWLIHLLLTMVCNVVVGPIPLTVFPLQLIFDGNSICSHLNSKWLLQNFAYAMHMQIFVAICCPVIELQQGQVFIEFELWAKKISRCALADFIHIVQTSFLWLGQLYGCSNVFSITIFSPNFLLVDLLLQYVALFQSGN